MSLSKMGGEKKLEWNCIFFVNCGNVIAKNGRKKNVVAEIWGEILKKCVTFTIFLQQITGY